MTILVGSDVPGLLTALEQQLGGSQQLTVARDAATLMTLIADPNYRIDAVILSDTITPQPGKEIATSLWELASCLGRQRKPLAPTVLTLAATTPTIIVDALRTEVQKTGGDLRLISQRARTQDHPEARSAVAWIVGLLNLSPQRRQYTLVSANNAGGSGKTSTLMHIGLQLNRLGLRVLVVDLDIAQGSLLSWFHAANDVKQFYTTLPEEWPQVVDAYPADLVERRIYHHPSGLSLLFAGQGLRDQLDMTTQQLEALCATIRELDYDVVCFDTPGEWKMRSVVVSLLAQETTAPLVVCPPGRKEREGAYAALDVLGKIPREVGASALHAAMVVFIEGERGQVTNIRTVRQQLLHAYPMVTDLGTLPRDPALLSVATEGRNFGSAFDFDPRRAYCRTIRAVTRRWIAAVDLPQTWLTRTDPHERRLLGWRGWAGRDRLDSQLNMAQQLTPTTHGGSDAQQQTRTLPPAQARRVPEPPAPVVSTSGVRPSLEEPMPQPPGWLDAALRRVRAQQAGQTAAELQEE